MHAGGPSETQSVQPLTPAPVEAGYAGFRRFSAPAPPVQRRQTGAVRCAAAWWLWPHLLSLDAPLVAVVWQGCWARAAHIRLPWCHPVVLGLGVWLIYLADRLADSARAVPGDHPAARHAFHARRRTALSFLAAAAAAALVLLTPHVLSRAEFVHGLFLLALAAVYFWLIHGREQQGWTTRLPKEAAVGGMFAVGTCFFPYCQGGMARPAPWAAAAIFGGICFCNCALITVWERQAQDVRNRFSLLNAFPWLTARLQGLCLVLAGLAGMGLLLTGSLPFLPLALGGFFLAVLDHQQRRISPDALRVLADAALLTPLLFGGSFW